MRILTLILLLKIFLVSRSQTIQSSRGAKIIGCTVAHMGEVPFAASIYHNVDPDSYFCTGAILNDQWIITAGQCLNGFSNFTIQVGSCSRMSGDFERITLNTSTSFIHPDFDFTSFQNDIGLIKLEEPIAYNDYILTIDLPNGPLGAGVDVTAFGWGYANESNPLYANNICRVQLSSISNQDCMTYYGDFIKPTMACADLHGGGTCTGDSGGPLAQYTDDGAVLVGINIFYSGLGCAQGPSGFTRVFDYVDWINSVIDANA